MRRFEALLFLVASFAVSLSLSASEVVGAGDGAQQVYIVYMGYLPRSESSEELGVFSAVETAHQDLLDQVLDDSSASDRILHSYKRSLNGFAARLTLKEAQRLSSMAGIVSVFPSRKRELLTTRSWDFLGFPQTPQSSLPLEGDVIVGMLDSGVWPSSPSFSDEGFGPPPSRWNGACQNFTCNNKIIGARAYRLGSNSGGGLSPVDEGGHGSHTASTVAGRAVGNVSLAGLAAGTARGAVPGARLAVYKVCHHGGCSDADILAAFDDAIADGVDVISFSIGSRLPSPYFQDAAAIGSFHAMKRGVVTSTAAGNSGPSAGHVCNVAPWLLSVAASSIDRRFVDKIVLGDGKTIVGVSINTFPALENATLVSPIDGSCDPDKLSGGSYKGKIVVCHSGAANGAGPLLGGAAGAVMVGDDLDVAFTVALPALVVSEDQLDEILAYVNGTSCFLFITSPNLITPGILKPDLSAPGIDIIAAWTGIPNTQEKIEYNIVSGTSMACPHVSGTVARKRLNMSFPRTVTNVGASASMYDAKVIIGSAAGDLAVVVTPSKLEFSAAKGKISFTVLVSGVMPAADEVASTVVVWSNGQHVVWSSVRASVAENL